MLHPSEPSQCARSDGEAQNRSELTVSCAAQIHDAKRAFTTRRVIFDSNIGLVKGIPPEAGDLVLARVTGLGHHSKLESPAGRRAQMYVDDLIVVAYGQRYAADQFEAKVPGDLDCCDLVASGGVAGKVLSRHVKTRPPTTILPVGLLADCAGRILNLSRFALAERELPRSRPRVIAVAGTSMNAGKTTTAASLIYGLARAGLDVAAAKVTGTGSGNDYWSMLDAGARQVLDFTDMGHASTAGLALEVVERAATSLISHCAADGADVIVLELADGLLQRETAGLLSSVRFRECVDSIVFAAADAMGAMYGRQWLMERGHEVIGVSGLITASSLASQEAADGIGEPLITMDDLRNPFTARRFAFGTKHQSDRQRVSA